MSTCTSLNILVLIEAYLPNIATSIEVRYRSIPSASHLTFHVKARLVALAKWGTFEAVRREYLKVLKRLPKQKPKVTKRKREETVIEEEPDPKKRRSGRLAGKARSRYVDDVDIF